MEAHRTGACGVAFHLRKTKAKNTVENVLCRFLSASFFFPPFHIFPSYLCTIAAVTAGSSSGGNSGASSDVTVSPCTASVSACLPACLLRRLQLHLHLFHPIILVNRRVRCVRARSLARSGLPSHQDATHWQAPLPCHLSRIVPNSTFCNYKNPGKSYQVLGSTGKWGKEARQAACWGFVVLVKICCSHFDCSLYCCCCCYRLLLLQVVVAAVFGIVAACRF